METASFGPRVYAAYLHFGAVLSAASSATLSFRAVAPNSESALSALRTEAGVPGHSQVCLGPMMTVLGVSKH